MAKCPFPGLKIVSDDVMGRCMESGRCFEVGNTILRESSFIFSTYDGRNTNDHDLFKAAFPRTVLNNLREIMDDLTQYDRVQSLDTARNFLIYLAIEILRARSGSLTDYFTKCGVASLDVSLTLLDELSGANMEECVADVKTFRSEYPRVIPKSMSDVAAARLLAVLNTNQVELEELGGSGLFVGLAILQHDCKPNCSYTTFQNGLVLTAIQTILPGERLSIDYGNHFYHPTVERRENLMETYGFVCTCSGCTELDTARAFRCQLCGQGILHPRSDGADNSAGWTCTDCGRRATDETIQACLAREDELKTTPPANLEAVVTEDILHESHHLLFWALNDISLSLAAEARSGYFAAGDGVPTAASLYARALSALKAAVRRLDRYLPPTHHERVVYYDRLAQLAVASGDLPLARESFALAHENSCRCSGRDAPSSQALLQLTTKTPKSVAELLEHYNQTKSAGDDEDEEWEDEEDEEEA